MALFSTHQYLLGEINVYARIAYGTAAIFITLILVIITYSASTVSYGLFKSNHLLFTFIARNGDKLSVKTKIKVYFD